MIATPEELLADEPESRLAALVRVLDAAYRTWQGVPSDRAAPVEGGSFQVVLASVPDQADVVRQRYEAAGADLS